MGRRVKNPTVERFFGRGAEVALLDLLVPILLRIRNREGRLIPLEPNAAQRQYAEQRGQRNIILKARQVGMTTYLAGRLFLATMLRPGTVTLQVAHSLESAQQIFRIVHRFYANLPVKFPTKMVVTERANVRELAFAESDSRFRVETAGTSSAGRGLTVRHLHASEVSEWPGKPEETMAALAAAVVPGGTIDIEATPKGVGGYFHREWMLAGSGDTGFVRHFFPWWLEPAYRLAIFPGEKIAPESEEEKRLAREYGLDEEQFQRPGLLVDCHV